MVSQEAEDCYLVLGGLVPLGMTASEIFGSFLMFKPYGLACCSRKLDYPEKSHPMKSNLHHLI